MGGFTVNERVRHADVDRAGIIYFGAYARLIDIVECELFRSLGFTFTNFDELGVALTRVHVEFDFFKPAVLDDELILRLRVSGVGIHSVRLKMEIYRASDEALLAEARLVAACVDRSRKSVPLPPAFADALRSKIQR
jgi:YbgC/YbaW family acyl-CoA thioester hydrolase